MMMMMMVMFMIMFDDEVACYCFVVLLLLCCVLGPYWEFVGAILAQCWAILAETVFVYERSEGLADSLMII